MTRRQAIFIAAAEQAELSKNQDLDRVDRRAAVMRMSRYLGGASGRTLPASFERRITEIIAKDQTK